MDNRKIFTEEIERITGKTIKHLSFDGYDGLNWFTAKYTDGTAQKWVCQLHYEEKEWVPHCFKPLRGLKFKKYAE